MCEKGQNKMGSKNILGCPPTKTYRKFATIL